VETAFHSVGSGSLFSRGSLKKLYRDTFTAEETVTAVVQALYDAADDDSATGGPDLGRRIWPTLAVVDVEGARFLDDQTLGQVAQQIVADRRDNPGGAR
jgi:proteasome beta subunit